jgi:hypothetical protein
MNRRVDPSQLGLGELFKLLRPGQVWAILVIMCMLVGTAASGAFVLGRAISDYERDRMQTELDDVKQGLRKQKVNLDFYEKYLRYSITLEQVREDGQSRYADAHSSAKADFVALVKRWYDTQAEGGAKVYLLPTTHKSFDLAHSRVRLPDRTEWPIPYEVKQLVLPRLPAMPGAP